MDEAIEHLKTKTRINETQQQLRKRNAHDDRERAFMDAIGRKTVAQAKHETEQRDKEMRRP